jgi:hypothetical protein
VLIETALHLCDEKPIVSAFSRLNRASHPSREMLGRPTENGDSG